MAEDKQFNAACYLANNPQLENVPMFQVNDKQYVYAPDTWLPEAAFMELIGAPGQEFDNLISYRRMMALSVLKARGTVNASNAYQHFIYEGYGQGLNAECGAVQTGGGNDFPGAKTAPSGMEPTGLQTITANPVWIAAAVAAAIVIFSHSKNSR